ncbi:MAG: hypothetical protein RUMPE_01036 [Eubacteriales bacterium SKADARSKE-1]|nr:hypothetical protein [Eubacteriales bacterium SKADARSKE-1]
MRCRIVDMRNKEVIHVKTGRRLGCVSDVEIDTIDARLIGIVIFGRLKCFGIFGREEDIFIRWEEIKVIGDDTILVSCDVNYKKKRNFFPLLNNFIK